MCMTYVKKVQSPFNMQDWELHKLVFSRSKREVMASMTADLENISLGSATSNSKSNDSLSFDHPHRIRNLGTLQSLRYLRLTTR
jgi:hypothetical protein